MVGHFLLLFAQMGLENARLTIESLLITGYGHVGSQIGTEWLTVVLDTRFQQKLKYM